MSKELWPDGPFALPDEGEFEKMQKKAKLNRCQFDTAGAFQLPIIKKDKIDLKNIDLWGYTKTKLDDKENAHKAVHFFTYDWLFEKVYSEPEKAMEKLEQYYALLTPDFSPYPEMPFPVKLYNMFKNRWCGAYWQSMGMKVIPTLEWWGGGEIRNACFEGIEEGCVVAISTYRRYIEPQRYLIGYNAMLEKIKPEAVICYGEKVEGMGGNVIEISPFDKEELIKQMGLEKFMEKYLDGSLYPSK